MNPQVVVYIVYRESDAANICAFIHEWQAEAFIKTMNDDDLFIDKIRLTGFDVVPMANVLR